MLILEGLTYFLFIFCILIFGFSTLILSVCCRFFVGKAQKLKIENRILNEKYKAIKNNYEAMKREM